MNKNKTFHSGLYEVHLPVTDLNRSVDFYVEKMGFTIGFGKRTDSSILLMYDKGDTRWMLGLFEIDEIDHRHPAEYHISFRIAEENADQMISFLQERDIQPLHPSTVPEVGGTEMKEPIVHGWMPAAAVFFRDPDGHLLELIADLDGDPRPEFNYRSLSEWKNTGLNHENRSFRYGHDGKSPRSEADQNRV